MKKSPPSSPGDTPAQRVPGRPSSLTKAEEQRYVTLRNWNFSQREAGALARNLPRARNGVRVSLSASTCQRLDNVHGPYAETPELPHGHSADSLRQLPERALVALADVRGDVSNRRYQEAAGLRSAVKPAKRPKKQMLIAEQALASVMPRAAIPEESTTYRAWHRASSVLNAFHIAQARTMTGRLASVREWCLEWSLPVELDADARRNLTPWEQIAATWDGEFIADADRETLLLPFRDETHPNITPASREAILSARSAMQSGRPQPARKFKLPLFTPEDCADAWSGDEVHD